MHRNGLSGESITVVTTEEGYYAGVVIDACMYTDPGTLLKASTSRNQVIVRSPLSESGLSLEPE